MKIIDAMARLFGSLLEGSRYVYYDGVEIYKSPNVSVLSQFNGIKQGFLHKSDLLHNMEVLTTLKDYENKISIINIFPGKRNYKVVVIMNNQVVYRDKLVFVSTGYIRTKLGKILYGIK